MNCDMCPVTVECDLAKRMAMSMYNEEHMTKAFHMMNSFCPLEVLVNNMVHNKMVELVEKFRYE